MKANITNPWGKPPKKHKTHKSESKRPVKNPTKKARKHRRLRNPFPSKGDMIDDLKMVGGAAVGLLGTFAVNKYLTPSIPVVGTGGALERFRGIVEVAPGIAAMTLGKKNAIVRGVGAGLAAGGVYDVVAKSLGTSLGMPALGEERTRVVAVRVPVEHAPSVGIQRAPSVGVERAPSVGIQRAPSVGGVATGVRQTRVGGAIFN